MDIDACYVVTEGVAKVSEVSDFPNCFSALIDINAKSQKIACLNCTERDNRALKLLCALLTTTNWGGRHPHPRTPLPPSPVQGTPKEYFSSGFYFVASRNTREARTQSEV